MSQKPRVQRVLNEIKKELGIGRARTYAKAKEIAASAQVSTETGIYLVAAQAGINLSRILPQEELNQIRQLHLQTSHQETTARARSKKPITKSITVTVGKTLKLNDPILPEKILAEAKEMAEEVYPLLYLFENSVRELILRVMKDKNGDDWWEKRVSRPVRETVEGRMTDEVKNAWHGKRGAHPIFYTDLTQLARIVQNNWSDFEPIIPSIQWLSQRLEEISQSRNPAMHMNPLSKRDVARVKVYFNDWESQVSAKRKQIPET
jgi:hypothetical protein